MKILVSDYDGTFFTDEDSIKINCKAIEKFINNGNLFVLSSGRSLKSLMDKVNDYNIPYTHLACCDGSFLFDKEKMMLYAKTISHDVKDVFSDLENLKRHKKIEYAYPDDYYQEYDRLKMLGSVAFTIEEDKINRDFLLTFKTIRKNHPEYQYDIYGYDRLFYYLIRPHGVSKASPIEYLEESLNIRKEDIYTIGDNTNDKELIRDYNGYRIGNNKDIIDVSLKEYNNVYELVDDIENKKVLKRW